MIKTVNGNLLDATEDIIGHQVNCQGAMKSGIALQLRDKYPGLFEQYERELMIFGYRQCLGKVQIVKFDDKIIANIFGQLNYGYEEGQVYTSINALKKALDDLRRIAHLNGKSVALPYNIGCGKGGADWEQVYKIIDIAFLGYEVTLYRMEE